MSQKVARQLGGSSSWSAFAEVLDASEIWKSSRSSIVFLLDIFLAALGCVASSSQLHHVQNAWNTQTPFVSGADNHFFTSCLPQFQCEVAREYPENFRDPFHIPTARWFCQWGVTHNPMARQGLRTKERCRGFIRMLEMPCILGPYRMLLYCWQYIRART